MQHTRRIAKVVFYFLLGAFTTTAFFISLSYLLFSFTYNHRIYPGVRVGELEASGLTEQQLISRLNRTYSLDSFSLYLDSPQATITGSARDLGLRLDTTLMASRAFSIGRQSKNPYYNFLQIYSSAKGQINLPLEITFDSSNLSRQLDKVSPQIEIPPVNAVFQFNPSIGPDRKGRVVAFSPSQNGIAIDRDRIYKEIKTAIQNQIGSSIDIQPETITLPIYTKNVSPALISSTADQMGIKDLLGEGISYFYDSIPGRVYNIHLGTQKVSGRLIAPEEIFSFDDSIGTVSAVFGFKKAYSIIKGKTVLDDGGGVCQVSTTLYRAVLNAGLPVVSRTAHSYRVGFYEQGGFLPGLDATVYPPDPDFRFKNDTGHWLLVQAVFDESQSKLSFDIFGTSDGRQTKILGPFIISTTPPPDPVYEDDPTKPSGTLTQVDTAHWGARVYFKREVTRNGQSLINETVSSDYIPWPARFLKGTKT